MERLTEKHYKASDGYYMKCSGTCGEGCCDGCPKGDEFVDRLGQIEDILGDAYDLDRLRELVEAEKQGRCAVLNGPNCLKCHYMHKDNGNCTAVGGFCTAVPAAHCPMLKELLAKEADHD